MKDIAKTIAFDREKFIPNEDNGVTLVEKLSCERVKAIDDFIIKQFYEAYNDTEISKLFIIDETEFARYLKATLPQYLKGENKKDEKKLKAFEIIDKKNVNVGMLKRSETVSSYNYKMDELRDKAKPITKDEFNLFKEVMK